MMAGRMRIVFAAAASLAAGLAAGAGEDWPQWRGPGRGGATVAVAPRWPSMLEKGWSVEVGEGHSSPVVSAGRVFAHAREGGDEVVRALDAATGRVLWTSRHPTPHTVNPAAAGHGPGPKSTPAVAGGRVFTFSISGVLTALDAATGRVAWRREHGARFRETAPLYGTALSPLAVEGMVVAHVGGHDDGALVALDAATGRERWAWAGDGPGYASPVLATLAGVRQVVALTQSRLAGVALADGRLLWSLPFTTGFDQNAVTPAVAGDRVIYSGLDRGVHAVRVTREGARWVTAPAWSNADVSMYMSSPVVRAGRVFGLSHRKKGQVFALDLATGALVFASEGRQGDNAAVALAGDRLVVLTTEAELTVAPADGPRYAPEATYTVADSPTWAHHALVPGAVIVKDARRLTLWRVR